MLIANLLFEICCIDKVECLKTLGDNITAIEFKKNPIFHTETKHIYIAVHYVRELVQSEIITIEYTNTEEQLADCSNKCLGKQQYQYLCSFMGIIGEAHSQLKG